MGELKTKTLQKYLRSQYFIFLLVLFSTFVVTSIVSSSFATIGEQKQQCAKLQERLEGLREILTREAIIGSKETMRFELEKLITEFALSKIYFSDSSIFRTASDSQTQCASGMNGFTVRMPIIFGSTSIGEVRAENHQLAFSKIAWVDILLPVFMSFLISFYLFYWLRNRFEKVIVSPLIELTKKIGEMNQDNAISVPSSIHEYHFLQDATNSMALRIRQAGDRIRVLEVAEELGKLSRQVAHDIRSPLTALTMLDRDLGALGEEKRILVRTVIQRINDIANDLLKKGNKEAPKNETRSGPGEELAIELIPILVDQLISEKRAEYGLMDRVQIEIDISESYGLFAKIDAKKLARALSNIVNNAVEALENQIGNITVRVSREGRKVMIRIRDSGRGMSVETLGKIGKLGFTSSKDGILSGHGLGVSFAAEAIREFGGSLTYESCTAESAGSLKDVGTVAILRLPLAEAPVWFVEGLLVEPNITIIVVDDDSAIHSVWEKRLRDEKPSQEIVYFTSIQEAEKYILQLEDISKYLFLIDHEFIGQASTGLEVIEKHNLGPVAILVTSHFDETEVKLKIADIGAKLIPKTMVPQIPIKFL
jgi:signal transduction histidine kinase